MKTINKKIKILDTNVFLSDPKALFAYPNELLVIPISVIEEIDEFKKGLNELGRNAREVLRKIDKLRKRGKISNTGIELNNKGTLIIELNHISQAPEGLSLEKVDNRLLAVAINYQKENPNSEVCLITKDANLRIKADAFNLMAEDYEGLSISQDESYKGYRSVEVSSEQAQEFSKRKQIKLDVKLNPNEFVIMLNEDKSSVGRYDHKLEMVVELIPLKKEVFGLTALNPEQRMALDLLMNPNIPLVSITGKAGTGKTLLAIAAGLAQTAEESIYRKVLVSRPIVPMGKDLGYLPGDQMEKLSPWMQPIFDNLEFLLSLSNNNKRNISQELMEQGILQVEALTYIRGRSIPEQYMIIDEAQNLTAHEIKTIITRAGQGTKIILTGDPDQIDNPYVDSMSNGLSVVVEKLKEQGLSGHIHLKQGERSELAEMASNAL